MARTKRNLQIPVHPRDVFHLAASVRRFARYHGAMEVILTGLGRFHFKVVDRDLNPHVKMTTTENMFLVDLRHSPSVEDLSHDLYSLMCLRPFTLRYDGRDDFYGNLR